MAEVAGLVVMARRADGAHRGAVPRPATEVLQTSMKDAPEVLFSVVADRAQSLHRACTGVVSKPI